MKMWIRFAIGILVLFPLTVTATGPVLPTKGTSCWNASVSANVTGYALYRTTPTGTIVRLDVGKPTTIPVPPTLQQACAPGQIGVVRDQTGQVDGQYSDQIVAYNGSGVESSKTAAFPFSLDKSLDLVAPAAPQSYEAK